jgi:peptide deformylase
MLKDGGILVFPNPSLQKQTAHVDVTTMSEDGLNFVLHKQYVIDELKKASTGIALAANQVGIGLRFFAVTPEFAKQFEVPEIIINPEYSSIGQDSIVESEGCLSFPGLSLQIKRLDSIDCTFEDFKGITHHKVLSGFPSRVFQHECEHLDGKLFTDNIPRIERFQLLAEIRKRGFRARAS